MEEQPHQNVCFVGVLEDAKTSTMTKRQKRAFVSGLESLQHHDQVMNGCFGVIDASLPATKNILVVTSSPRIFDHPCIRVCDVGTDACHLEEEAHIDMNVQRGAGNASPPALAMSARKGCYFQLFPQLPKRCCTPRQAPLLVEPSLASQHPSTYDCRMTTSVWALLRRLRLPLPLVPRRCHCGRHLDPLGDHRAACPTSGHLAARGPALEVAVARVCREAGGRVARNVALADMNLDEPVADGRRLEIVANGLGLYHGQQLAIDTTCISPITRAGEPHPGADTTPGRAADNALQRKRRRYPELTRARRCRLIVFAIEVGGRWGSEALQVTRALAHARAAEAPPWLRAAAANAWLTRWSAIIAVAAQRALATTLLELPAHGASIGGDMPELPDLLADDRWQTPAGPSRMPAA